MCPVAAKPLTLTGGVGTLKRKRELCQMLDAFNDNHEDDFFDATPVRQAKRLKVRYSLDTCLTNSKRLVTNYREGGACEILPLRKEGGGGSFRHVEEVGVHQVLGSFLRCSLKFSPY